MTIPVPDGLFHALDAAERRATSRNWTFAGLEEADGDDARPTPGFPVSSVGQGPKAVAVWS